MGAHNFEAWSSGDTMDEAYRKAVGDAREESGNDPYNGTISTTQGFKDVTEEYRNSKKSLDKFKHENLEKAEKWGACLGICIEPPKGNKNKTKSTVEHIVNKGRMNWKLVYMVHEVNEHQMIQVGFRETKGEAVKLARQHTEVTKRETHISMEKMLQGGNTVVAVVKYKKSSDERTGKYVFFGWAAT